MPTTVMTRFLACAAVLVAVSAGAQVPFVAETVSIPTNTAGDLAIVWDRGASGNEPLIAAGDPLQNGLYVFRVDGGLVQVLPYGAMRGVDSRSNLALGSAPATVIAAAAAVTQQVVFGSYAPAGGLTDVTGTAVQSPSASALTLYRPGDAGLELFVDNSAGTVRRFVLEDDGSGLIAGTQTGMISLPGVPSAMVVDDRFGTLYAAIPAQGVFRVDLRTGTPSLLASISGGGFNGNVAGLTFYPLSDGGGLLLTTVPSQDDVTVHALAGPSRATFLTRFTVTSGSLTVRGPQHVDVVPNRMPGFDAGLFVIHDVAFANYKLVPWEAVATRQPVQLPIEVPEDMQAVDAGVDAGQPDAGERLDAGAGDGGTTDGGARDGGSSGGGGTGPGPQPVEEGCSCSAVDPFFFPGLFGLWILRRSRRRRVSPS